MYSEYEPGAFMERIAPTPLLMVLGDADVVCPTDLALAAFNRAGEPKRLELYPAVTSRLTPTRATAWRRPPPNSSRSICGPRAISQVL